MVKDVKMLIWSCCLLLIGCQKKNYLNQSGASVTNANAEYDIDREALIAKDSTMKIDASIVFSPDELRASIKFDSLRNTLLAQYHQQHFYPFTKPYFFSDRSIYATDLYKLIRKMPKGGLLHLHPSAGLDFHWLVEQACIQPNCYVYWPSTNSDEKYLKGQIHFYAEKDVPNGFHLAADLNKENTHFKDQLYRLLVFDKAEAKDSVAIWKEFEYRFRRINGFVGYQPVFKSVLKNIFSNLLEDGIMHAELREHLAGSLYDLQHAKGYYNTDTIIHYYQNVVNDLRQTKNKNLTYSIIYTNIRFLPKDSIVKDFERAYYYQSKYPEIIKGYDLVAEEDAGNTGLYYKDAYILNDSLAKVYHRKLELILHAGESTWEYNKNLYDAAVVHAKRVGHGINLVYYPALMQQFKAQNICVEVNPMSNQILGYVADVRMHPAHALINNGVQIAISSDDPALFQYKGVSLDYWSVILGWEMPLKMLKKIVRNSLEYSLLDHKEKEIALDNWDKDWTRFIVEINNKL